MTTYEQLLKNQLGLVVIIFIILLAFVSRYLTARNEKLLILIGEQKKQKSPLRAWTLTSVFLIFIGLGMIVESYLESVGQDINGILLVFAGIGIGIAIVIRMFIESDETDEEESSQ